MKNLRSISLGTVPVLTTDVSFAQSVNMMHDGAWGNSWMGGYGGIWMPVLTVIVVVALVVWMVQQRK